MTHGLTYMIHSVPILSCLSISNFKSSFQFIVSVSDSLESWFQYNLLFCKILCGRFEGWGFTEKEKESQPPDPMCLPKISSILYNSTSGHKTYVFNSKRVEKRNTIEVDFSSSPGRSGWWQWVLIHFGSKLELTFFSYFLCSRVTYKIII